MQGVFTLNLSRWWNKFFLALVPQGLVSIKHSFIEFILRFQGQRNQQEVRVGGVQLILVGR